MPRQDPMDRSTPPPAGRAQPFSFPPFHHSTLASGLGVYVLPTNRFPLARIDFLATSAGGERAAGSPGLPAFTAGLLDEGTSARTALEIAHQVEHLGGCLSTAADWNSAVVSIELLSPSLPTGIGLLAEVLTTPTFPDKEIERLRQQRLAEVRRRQDEPSALADMALAKALYRGTIYENALLGTESSLRSFERSDFVEFFTSQYSSSGSALVVAGDVQPEAIVSQVEEAFATMSDHPPPLPSSIAPPRSQGIRTVVVDRPEGAQTALRVGCVGVPRLHSDRIALRLLNCIFGGKFTSRINLNLRERHGYTYGARSYFVERRGPGPFLITAAVASDVAGASVKETFCEIERLLDEPVSEAELQDAKSYLLGVFPYTLQTVDGLAERMTELANYGLPDDYFTAYGKELGSLTPEDLLAAARKHLDPTRMTVIAVGPANQLLAQLEGQGEVEVVSPEEVAHGSAS